jgi:hypothetical protein
MFVLHTKHLWASISSYVDSFTFLYVDGVCTSHNTYMPPSTQLVTGIAYDDNGRTSQETPLWATKRCYGEIFTLVYFLTASVV